MRSNAFQYTEPSWNSGNNSYLQKKVSIQLGLKSLDTRSLIDVLVETGVEIISDEEFEQSQNGDGRPEFVDAGEIGQGNGSRFQVVPANEFTKVGSESGNGARGLAEIAILKRNPIGESVFRSGVDVDSYLVGGAEESGDFQLVLQRDEHELSLKLASYVTKEKASAAANNLRRMFIWLNTQCEGFHVVEHILLRPLDSGSPRPTHIPGDFYSLRISVVFPGWTARFHDELFKRFAEETIQLNCPAHIYPEFHWLDFPKMREFEGIYRQWLELKSTDTATPHEIDSASGRMIEFFLPIRPKELDDADGQQ